MAEERIMKAMDQLQTSTSDLVIYGNWNNVIDFECSFEFCFIIIFCFIMLFPKL